MLDWLVSAPVCRGITVKESGGGTWPLFDCSVSRHSLPEWVSGRGSFDTEAERGPRGATEKNLAISDQMSQTVLETKRVKVARRSRRKATWDPWINKCFDIGTAVSSRYSGRRPAIYAFFQTRTACRGWRAFARHDDRRLATLANRFGYFVADP